MGREGQSVCCADTVQIEDGSGELQTERHGSAGPWENMCVFPEAVNLLSSLGSGCGFLAPSSKEKKVENRIEILLIEPVAEPSMGLSTPNAKWTPFVVYVKKKERSWFVLKLETPGKPKPCVIN